MNTIKENIERIVVLVIVLGVIFLMANDGKYVLFPKESSKESTSEANKNNDSFKYQTEQFADLKMIRYQVPGFENLDLRQKKLIYYLSQASLSGRDIIFDQNYRHNLKIRRVLEAIVKH